MFKVFLFRCVAHRWQTRQMLHGIGRFMRNYIYIKNEVGRIRDVQSILFRCVAHRWQTRQMLRGIGRFMRNYIYIKNEVGRTRDVQSIFV